MLSFLISVTRAYISEAPWAAGESEGAKMLPPEKRSRYFTEMLVAIAFMLAITALFYNEGRTGWYAWPILVIAVAASVGGYWFRVRPNVAVWRAAYIVGFARWVELAWIFGWVILMAATPLGPYVLTIPALPRFALQLIAGYVIGAFVGDYIGRRRNYTPPNLP